MSQIDPARTLRALQRLGFVVIRTKGSHHFLRGPQGQVTTVNVHPGTMKLGTARAVLKQAKLSEEEFFRAY